MVSWIHTKPKVPKWYNRKRRETRMLNYIYFFTTNNGGSNLGGTSTTNFCLVPSVLNKLFALAKKMKFYAASNYCYKYTIAAFTTTISNVNMCCFYNLQYSISNNFYRGSCSGKSCLIDTYIYRLWKKQKYTKDVGYNINSRGDKFSE